MNRIRPWIAIAMIAVAVLGVGALLVTIYATLATKTDVARDDQAVGDEGDVAQLATRAEQRVRVDQQPPDLVGDVSETTAAVNRVNEELYRTNAELVLVIETVEATNAELLARDRDPREDERPFGADRRHGDRQTGRPAADAAWRPISGVD